MRAARAESLSAADVTVPAGHRLRLLPPILLVVGLLSLGAALTSWGSEPMLFSWLVAFTFWCSIGVGSLFFVLVHYATKADWSLVVRRIAENLMLPLPLMVLLFLPIFAGRQHLFHWLEPGVIEHDPLLQAKSWWLDEGFWNLRWILYFAVWAALVFFFYQRSRLQDRRERPELTARLIRLSMPAMILFALSTTGASIDWIMGLDPHWYSTMFGVYFFSGAVAGASALLTVVAVQLRRSGVLGGAVTIEHLHDLGKFLFTFVVFWAYIAFSQYFLIWYGNIPEETTFFMHRGGGWKGLSAMLGWGHFLVPFFFLMSYKIKRNPPLLVAGCLWMLAMHFLDVYWLIIPTLHHEAPAFGWLDVATFVGIGSLYLAAATWGMVRGPLVPLGDPRLERSLAFENV